MFLKVVTKTLACIVGILALFLTIVFIPSSTSSKHYVLYLFSAGFFSVFAASIYILLSIKPKKLYYKILWFLIIILGILPIVLVIISVSGFYLLGSGMWAVVIAVTSGILYIESACFLIFLPDGRLHKFITLIFCLFILWLTVFSASVTLLANQVIDYFIK